MLRRFSSSAGSVHTVHALGMPPSACLQSKDRHGVFVKSRCRQGCVLNAQRHHTIGCMFYGMIGGNTYYFVDDAVVSLAVLACVEYIKKEAYVLEIR